MPSSTAHLRLRLAFPEPGHRLPAIAIHVDDRVVGRILTSEPIPHLAIESGAIDAVDARDVLEHVHDEQAWLAELARVLKPGGELTVRVPLDNLLAWADALNIYRYLGDIFGFWGVPVESLPTGWHRRYAPGDLPAILELAGFDVISTATRGLPLEEAPHLVGLIAGNLSRNPRATNRRLFHARRHVRDRPRLPMPTMLAATITVRARKVTPGFRPDPDLDPDDRPEHQASGSLE